MKDRGYLVVAGLVALGIAADVYLNQAAASMFLIRKLVALVEFLAFWR